MIERLQKECARYLNSEGIFYQNERLRISACIRSNYVVFEFADDASLSRKFKASGGKVYRPRSLEEFIEIVRKIQNTK